MAVLSKFDVSDEFPLTTWSLGLMLSSGNGLGELDPLSNLEQYLKKLYITDICSRSNIVFHINNIIIDLMKVRMQKMHAGILVTINVRVQVGDLT